MPTRRAVLYRVAIAGHSMSPALEPGDRLLLVRGMPVRPGHLVGVLDPRDPPGRERLLVKRVVEIRPDGVVVAGDNPDASTDSRDFGAVPRRLLRGRAVYRYAPAARRGLVTRL